jgi:hypothetical protein
LDAFSGYFTYSASNTNSAQQNTSGFAIDVPHSVGLTLGTVGLPHALCTGDTFLRLYAPNGTQLAFNDNAVGLCSNISYGYATAGTYTVRAGCAENTSCSGRVAFSLFPERSSPTTCGKLSTGQGLRAGESLSSCDGRFYLRMETSGDVRLMQRTSPQDTLLWQTNVGGGSGNTLILLDFMLALMSSTGSVRWSAQANEIGVYVAVQNDGNLVLYTSNNIPVWASNTCCR